MGPFVEINNKIRDQVIADLKAALVDDDGEPLVKVYINGRGEPVTAYDDEQAYIEVPAIAVYMSDGEIKEEDFGVEVWETPLHIEIMELATNQLDPELDVLGDMVRKVIKRDYTANGLATYFNRQGFQYLREEDKPWGSLILTFSIEMETD